MRSFRRRIILDQSYNYQGPFNFDKVPISWVSDNQEINEGDFIIINNEKDLELDYVE